MVGSDSIPAKRLFETLDTVHEDGGAVCSPFDSWLILRGLRSLGARMKMHCDNAIQVAEAMEAHDCIERVLYPGLKSHPQHEVARRQMTGPGYSGMMSLLVKGGKKEALSVMRNVKLLRRATSLGGTETLIEHRK